MTRPKLSLTVLAMPVLVTGILGTMAATAPSSTSLQPASAPTVMKVEPTTTIAKKPTPVGKLWVAPVEGYRLTARFGASSGLWSRDHTGLDFAAPSGTTIRSIMLGTVVSSSYDGAYGLKTVVRWKDGTEFWYCHQASADVSVGEHVRPGQPIGTVGSTGNVTGPHLHLEIRPSADSPVDPYAALVRHGVRL